MLGGFGGLVNQTGTAEFGVEAMAKDFGKATLVVVKALLGFVIDCADIDDNITRIQNSWVACSFEI